jgi:hypothetical protein
MICHPSQVVDARMLAAVTSAVVEEVHGVLPRTAAGAVWALARLGYEAPAFMEAALDRWVDTVVALGMQQNTLHSDCTLRGWGVEVALWGAL